MQPSTKSNGSGGAGRQLSKAERYRWIIQEPKQPTHTLQQNNQSLRKNKGTCNAFEIFISEQNF